MALLGEYKVHLEADGTPTWKLSPATETFTSTGTIKYGDNMYIDPKTLKPCKHRWYPDIRETAGSWTITPRCDRCGVTGSPKDKGVSLAKLVKQLG